MPDALPTIWEGTPHTFAKHQILETYLKAWLPIMSRQSHGLGVSQGELLFVDGFAGPGSYTGGQDGSPILAIKSVLQHTHDFHIPVRFLFIEEVHKRYESLCKALQEVKPLVGKSHRIKSVTVREGDCEEILNEYINDVERENQRLGPGFFFLDQFGYTDVSMKLIRRIMKHHQCEILSYLNWARMNQFITDRTKWAGMTNAFGGEGWKPALELAGASRAKFILNKYRDALMIKGASRYVWYFAMADKDDKLLYWLFFCSNSLRGLEEMKRAMWKVDRHGGFRFSDKEDPSQLSLFESCTDEILGHDLASTLIGQTRSVSKLKEFVLTQTPAYKYKNALRLLEKEEAIKVTNCPANRRRGTFPDEHIEAMQVKFLSNRLV